MLTNRESDAGNISKPVLIGLVTLFAVLAAVSWARWGNVRIDAGTAVYRAAAVSQGQVLYRDIHSPYGPVAPYVVAALFALLGIQLNVVYGVGLAVLATESVLLWRITRRFLPEPETAAGLAGFWVLLAFCPGLFNWILPNTFAATFAVLFATAVLALTTSYLDEPRTAKLVAASLCTALSGMSKAEFGVAAFGTLSLAVLLLRPRERRLFHDLALIVLPGFFLTVAVLGAFAVAVPWRELVFDNLYRTRSFRLSVSNYKDGLFPPLLPLLGGAVLHYGIELPVRIVILTWGFTRVRLPGTLRVLGGGAMCAALLAPILPVYPIGIDFMVNSPFVKYSAAPFAWTPVGWAAVAVIVAVLAVRRVTLDSASKTIFIVATYSLLALLRWDLRVAWQSYYAVFAPFLAVLIVRRVASVVTLVRPRWAVASVLLVTLASGARHGWESYAAYTGELRYPRGVIAAHPLIVAPFRRVINYVRANTGADEYVAVIPDEHFINFFAERWHPATDPGIGAFWLANQEDVVGYIADLERRGTRMIVFSNRHFPEFKTGGVAAYNPGIVQYILKNYSKALVAGPFTVFTRKFSTGKD